MKLDAQITFMYVSDLERSARFYEDILGFELTLDQVSCRIYRVVGSTSFIGLCQGAAASKVGPGIILTLVTADVDGWYDKVIRAGWACDHPPRRNETYNIYHVFLRDPDGYRIEIQRFESEAWSQSIAKLSP